jgi:DNA primase
VPASSHFFFSSSAFGHFTSPLETAQKLFIETMHKDAGSAVKEYHLRRGYSEADIDVMEVDAFTNRSALQKQLKDHGFSEKRIRDSGLLTTGFGETHTLIIPWEDAAGRTIGIVGRTVLSAEQVRAKGIPKYKYSAGLVKSEGLIGFTGIRGAESIVLAEGVLDARYLNSKGFKVASIGGSDVSLAQIPVGADVRKEIVDKATKARGRQRGKNSRVNLSLERRSEIAKKAAAARWGKKKP